MLVSGVDRVWIVPGFRLGPLPEKRKLGEKHRWGKGQKCLARANGSVKWVAHGRSQSRRENLGTWRRPET